MLLKLVGRKVLKRAHTLNKYKRFQNVSRTFPGDVSGTFPGTPHAPKTCPGRVPKVSQKNLGPKVPETSGKRSWNGFETFWAHTACPETFRKRLPETYWKLPGKVLFLFALRGSLQNAPLTLTSLNCYRDWLQQQFGIADMSPSPCDCFQVIEAITAQTNLHMCIAINMLQRGRRSDPTQIQNARWFIFPE
jgi:hypothetical protein